jgi:hypothetical protein
VFLLLASTPIQGTLQLQQQVAVQPPNSYFSIHNLVVFFWGDPASGLEQKPLSVSYFPAKALQRWPLKCVFCSVTPNTENLEGG